QSFFENVLLVNFQSILPGCRVVSPTFTIVDFVGKRKTCCVLEMSEGQAWTLKIVRARRR
ncbi:hypothetical protein ALC57_01379, partial [Trachymyrmex cornetzi]